MVVGQNLTYIITVRNNGPDTATGVTVTDTLPSTVTFVSANASQGTCSGTATVTCNLGSLNNGAQATVTIVVRPTQAGSLSNTVAVSGNETDPNPQNSGSTDGTSALPVPTLTIAIGANSPPGGTTYSRGQTLRPMLQFVATAGASEPVRMTALTLNASGTGNDQTGVVSVKVYLDSNGNGQFDTGETLVGSGTYSADNGTLTITFGTPQVIVAGAPRTYLVTYDFAP